MERFDIDDLYGKMVDPCRMGPEWRFVAIKGGFEITGHIVRRKAPDRDEMLDMGVLNFGGGPGMPVVIYARIETDAEFRITSICLDANATSGPAHGRPIQCAVTDDDEEQIAEEIGRFLDVPRLEGGKVVEERDWLEKHMETFDALSETPVMIEERLNAYVGRAVKLKEAAANGWELHENGSICYGCLKLFTNCCHGSFWAAMILELDGKNVITAVKPVLYDDRPPTFGDVREYGPMPFGDEFNARRMDRALDAITSRPFRERTGKSNVENELRESSGKKQSNNCFQNTTNPGRENMVMKKTRKTDFSG
ncbi:MAG TPA: hypothetical protein PLU72_05365 [Candidatus Ozemobacteraceae bacterium]|nr:hypothetical protein [Candidatus Ozemobacteraceae bacterium]HQG29264.1 hypothetical protein [Candidatus Ozemobacteraceae bacterium]